MLCVSMDCPFLIAPSVFSAQCCLCLWIVHSWVPLLCLVPNVVCVPGFSILDCPFCFWCSMLPMSLDCPFLIAPSVSSAQFCLCLWIVHSWLPLLCLVTDVVCLRIVYSWFPFSVWCPLLPMSLDCPFLIAPSVSNAQCCPCLWIVHSWLPLLCLVPNVAYVSGLSILEFSFCV
jgi:hypothetical protein